METLTGMERIKTVGESDSIWLFSLSEVESNVQILKT